MTQRQWTWSTGWIDVSIAGLLIVTAIGAGLLGSRERALETALEAAGADLDDALLERLCDPVAMAPSVRQRVGQMEAASLVTGE